MYRLYHKVKVSLQLRHREPKLMIIKGVCGQQRGLDQLYTTYVPLFHANDVTAEDKKHSILLLSYIYSKTLLFSISA